MSTDVRTPPNAAPASAVPPLEPGDQLSREEFERRYEAMPHIKKAELIEGVVHMASAVRWENHATPHADLIGCLGFYRMSTPGVSVGDNGSIRLDLDNEPQPDVTMIIEPRLGGQATISSDDYIEGAPELVAEVSASTVSIDLNTKLRVYRRNGVREYLAWRVYDRVIDWFVLRHAQYERLAADAQGITRSEVFPGFWLDTGALVRADLPEVLRVLQQGAGSPEHTAFVSLLKSRAPRPGGSGPAAS